MITLFRGGYLLVFLLFVYFGGASIYWSSVEWNPVSSPLLIWTAIPLIVFSGGTILLLWSPAEGEPTEWLMPLLFPLVAFMICLLMVNFYVLEPMKLLPETHDEVLQSSWEDVNEPSENPNVLIPQFSLDPGQASEGVELHILPPKVDQPEMTPSEPPAFPLTFYFSTISLILMAVYSLMDRIRARQRVVGHTYRLVYCIAAVGAIVIAIYNVAFSYGPTVSATLLSVYVEFR